MARSRSEIRSPLALLVLALLREHPMHIYGLHRLIRERGQDRLVNVEHRNSVRQTIERLRRDGCVEVDEVQSGPGPARTVYRINSAGTALLEGMLRETIASPRREYPVFPVAASLLAFFPPAEVVSLLAERRAALLAVRAELVPAPGAAPHIPRVFLIENELQTGLIDAEIVWIDAVVDGIRSEDLDWDTDALIPASPTKDLLNGQGG